MKNAIQAFRTLRQVRGSCEPAGDRRTLRAAAPRLAGPWAVLLVPMLLAGCGSDGGQSSTAVFQSGNLVVTRAVYAGTASTVSVGQTLPGGGVAINDGTFPNVFRNVASDPSFGVNAPIYLDQRSTGGTLISTLTVDAAQITTSFSSKAELGLNVSMDGTAVTFMGYKAPVNALDVATSNTAAVVDPTNPVKDVYARAVGRVNLQTGELAVTSVNAYSGNNGRAAVMASGTYYMVGNSNNGDGDGYILSALSDNTGVQSIAVTGSGNTTVIGEPIGTYGSAKGYQRGFSLAQVDDPANPGKKYAADKTGKDCNFRGLTIFGGTLYVSKGSGSNGVNTVYQVGTSGALANGGNLASNVPITILPGFNALSEKAATAATPTPRPFGIWFADTATVYVADEGDGLPLGASGKVTTFAGLAQYKLSGGKWTLAATFQAGLLDQATYTAGLPWNIKADGLRNLAGRANGDGSVTIYATTATITDEATHDAGADPNQLVAITINAASTPANTSFRVLQTAKAGERYGGVVVVP